MAAYVAASTVTAVVAAEDEARQEAARDLRSPLSSPCQWFVCDEADMRTRCFVIQGSDSVASWQANLLFEPTAFEDTGVLVHRGIYEAAKGIYEQLMPEIVEHLRAHKDGARLRFTGHSLGGSLALLVSLMLVARGVVGPESLLPVVTFGAPSVFCGGQRVLEALGVGEDHVRAVAMHRDIVPRAFSCRYPGHAVAVLKRLNGALRTHPCLNSSTGGRGWRAPWSRGRWPSAARSWYPKPESLQFKQVYILFFGFFDVWGECINGTYESTEKSVDFLGVGLV
ncbi:unnamed protein product [Triticum turgidum subsp. durum]|uniref:Fungal lipase-type domain-containing protein n=1 Tax=Triticum turgidum subsp. durum TaxID=4567 RepID=A0A9R0VJW8_TRITD|nr:unnamed protein product [Triticum turgidum subsp. durum]